MNKKFPCLQEAAQAFGGLMYSLMGKADILIYTCNRVLNRCPIRYSNIIIIYHVFSRRTKDREVNEG